MAAPINLLTRFLVNLSPCSFVPDLICNIFNVKFNIMSALFVHQLPTRPQKIDSREGWF